MQCEDVLAAYPQQLPHFYIELLRLLIAVPIRLSPVAGSLVGKGGGGEGLRIPINGLIGMCCWMGSHFHDWNDSNGVAFSTEFPTELLEWGRKLSAFWGARKFWLVGFKHGKIRGKRKCCYKKNCRRC